MVIGKGGETIRALEADHDVQIDIEEDGTILVYATEGTKANAAIAAIQALTKEPEVGDTYTGKVVKTTQFGAFVELKKGTDGLLHVSNVGPGRVGHIEDVIARGDVLDVIVQEVDKERGRIGLKLVAKHENGSLVQPEELIERAKNAPPREREEERPRGDRDRRGGRGGRDRGPRRESRNVNDRRGGTQGSPACSLRGSRPRSLRCEPCWASRARLPADRLRGRARPQPDWTGRPTPARVRPVQTLLFRAACDGPAAPPTRAPRARPVGVLARFSAWPLAVVDRRDCGRLAPGSSVVRLASA